MPPDRTVAAFIAKSLQLFINPDPCQPFPRRSRRIDRKQLVKCLAPSPHPRKRLVLTLVMELRLTRAQNFAHHFARDLQLAADLLDRLSMNQRKAPYLCNRLHNQHPKTNASDRNRKHSANPALRGPVWMKTTPQTGSLFHEKSHRYHWNQILAELFAGT